MVASLILAAAAVAAAAAPDSAPPAPRIVRQLDPIEVRAPRLDPRSNQTVREISSEALRTLPVDRLADAIALEPGVVSQGGEIHVRGGRAGELSVLLEGIALNDPRRGVAMELPLLAVDGADLVNGGLDAEYGGALAGVLDLRTVEPGRRWSGEVRYQSSGALSWRYDRVGARVSGPVSPAFGIVASGEATLDDTHLPALRTRSRDALAGGSFGWRADNRMTGYAKLSTLGRGPRAALHVLANRRVDRPYDPMWSFDRYVGFCVDGGETCYVPVDLRDEPAAGYARYRAADHKVMTDTRSAASVLALGTRVGEFAVSLVAGWMRTRAITSLDGRDDASYVTREHRPYWGAAGRPSNPAYVDPTDPFLVYAGDEPFFRRAGSDAVTLRADVSRTARLGNRVRAGAGVTYHDVSLWELDLADVDLPQSDSLRAYRAFAPGGFAYAQGRWQFQGLALNAGMRAQYFTAGREAGGQWRPGPMYYGDSFSGDPHRGVWSLSPRLGMSYPMSSRDAFSLAYIRIDQEPLRDLLYDGGRERTYNRRPFGNSSLVPSTVVSYETSLRHQLDRSRSLTLSLFYRDLFGQVGTRDRDAQPHFTQLQYANADEGHASGFEVSAFQEIAGRSSARLTYTYMEAWGTHSREEGSPYGPRLNDRALPIGEHPLDWDRRHSFSLALARSFRHGLTATWSTVAGSGLPWTPRPLREYEADASKLNAERLPWSESSSLTVRWRPPFYPAVSFGLDVRNVFNGRGETRTTVDGHPHPYINSLYDDYSAHRAATGNAGGAYWDDPDGDGTFQWVPVHDPRLLAAPRAVRFSVTLGS